MLEARNDPDNYNVGIYPNRVMSDVILVGADGAAAAASIPARSERSPARASGESPSVVRVRGTLHYAASVSDIGASLCLVVSFVPALTVCLCVCLDVRRYCAECESARPLGCAAVLCVLRHKDQRGQRRHCAAAGSAGCHAQTVQAVRDSLTPALPSPHTQSGLTFSFLAFLWLCCGVDL